MFIRKMIAAAAAVVVTCAIAIGAQIPLLTGPQPAADLVSIINGLINSINGSVGLLSANTSSVATGATTAETTLQNFVLNPNTLTNAGQSLRVTCWGVTGANTNTKTTKLYFGSSVISTATEASNNQKWWLDFIVTRKTATTQGIVMRGQAGTGSVTPLAPVTADATETLTSAVTIKCTGTNGTASASDITANGMLVEVMK